MRNGLVFGIAVALLLLVPRPAEAGGLVAAVSAIASWWGGLSALTQSLIQLGAGLVLTKASARQPSSPDLKREFPARTSLPAKRFVYGHTRMTGTPAPWRVKGGRLYGCILFNSRPSAGTNLLITVDGRRCSIALREDEEGETLPPEAQGTLTDFESPGALIKIEEDFPDWDPAERQFVAWIGLGDQTSPPDDILSDVPEYFEATDGWQGQTVLWVSLSAGGSVAKRPKRWPNPEPVIELEMDWSRVWDPEDEAQDRDDPTSWTYSDNQGRCLLDAVRFNPVRAHDVDQIWLDSFIAAVPVADEDVALWHASLGAEEPLTEKRYRVAGPIKWAEGELADQLEPIAAAGAGRLARVGGRLAYIPGAYRAPVYAMFDILADAGIDFQRMRSSRDVPYALKGKWTAPERQFEEAELDPCLVPGGSSRVDAIEDLPLPLCPSGTQCQRVTRIEALRLSAQKTLSCVLPPSAIALMPGSNVTGALPAPFTRLNGIWQVREANPGVWLSDGDAGRVAFRVPVVLAEESPDFYAWDPEEDETAIRIEELTNVSDLPDPPQNFAVVSEEIDSGGAVLLMLRWSFDPPANSVIDEYEMIWRKDPETAWSDLPKISGDADLNADGKLTGLIGPVEYGAQYDVGVRTVAPTAFSFWTYQLDIAAGLTIGSVSANAAPGRLEVSGTAPGITGALRLYRSAVGASFVEAEQVGEDLAIEVGSAFDSAFGTVDAVNLLAEPDFSGSSAWSEGLGWSISGGEAEHVVLGGSGSLSQATSLLAGEVYRVTLSVSELSGSGAAAPRLVGSATMAGPEINATGIYAETITAPDSPDDFEILADSARGIVIAEAHLVQASVGDLPQGAGDFWLVPITTTGSEGTPLSLGSHIIP